MRIKFAYEYRRVKMLIRGWSRLRLKSFLHPHFHTFAASNRRKEAYALRPSFLRPKQPSVRQLSIVRDINLLKSRISMKLGTDIQAINWFICMKD